MGYTTDFYGEFTITPALKPEHKEYLEAFAHTRRMSRYEDVVRGLSDPVRENARLPVGREGEFYVGAADLTFGQIRNESVKDYNAPPATQPGLWCQWVPNETGDGLEHDGCEKFYYYVEWLEYIITNFLTPWGYELNGDVEWQGEDRGDIGRICVKKNVVVAKPARISYDD